MYIQRRNCALFPFANAYIIFIVRGSLLSVSRFCPHMQVQGIVYLFLLGCSIANSGIVQQEDYGAEEEQNVAYEIQDGTAGGYQASQQDLEHGKEYQGYDHVVDYYVSSIYNVND